MPTLSPNIFPSCNGHQRVAWEFYIPSTCPASETQKSTNGKRIERKQNVGQRKGIGCERRSPPTHLSSFYKTSSPGLGRARWFPMAIQEKLMQAVVEHRAQLALTAALAAAVVSLLSVGPSFSAVAGFFWPLLVSTAFLLVAVAVLLRISPPPGETSGEELIDYVAGRPEDAQLAGPYEETPDAGREGEAEAERVKHQKSQ
ncbi:unnamed protein product [Musa acuminata subsp. burmannicoides]